MIEELRVMTVLFQIPRLCHTWKQYEEEISIWFAELVYPLYPGLYSE